MSKSKHSRFLAAFLAVLVGLTAAAGALADSIVLDGTVTADGTEEVYAPIGGTVERVHVKAGDQVGTGTPLATLRTVKVYAPEDGTVTGVFGQPGDAVETVAARYGAVMYLEGTSVCTVAATTANAFNSADTKFVHVGEHVWLVCRSASNRTGEGTVTAVDGTSYTVEVEGGSFIMGDSVDVFRDAARSNNQRIGRGTVARRNPTAVSGTGSIVSFAVENGASVKRGDLLFETLEGSFDGYYMSGRDILATTDGTVSEVRLTAGSAAAKNSVAAVLYPTSAMRVEAQVTEDDLASVAVGDRVQIELTADEDTGAAYEGTVTGISALATAGGSGDVTFTVYIDFEADAHVRYGMSATVTTLEEQPAEDAEPAEAVEAGE